jgi:DNA recombination protein RmuC
MTGFEITALVALTVIIALQLLCLKQRLGNSNDSTHLFRIEDALRSEIGNRCRETGAELNEIRNWLDRKLAELSGATREAREGVISTLNTNNTSNREQLEQLRRLIDEKLLQFVSELESNKGSLQSGFNELTAKLAEHTIAALKAHTEHSEGINIKLQLQTDSVLRSLNDTRTLTEQKLTEIQGGNERKLEEMRQTVDEKLKSTLEQRIGESFKQVVLNLESVQRGLGEMQNLAKGVGDLNRVFNNVKTRGIYGEIQLRAILEEMLRPEQFIVNFKPRPDTANVVEFAIKIPNSKQSSSGELYSDSLGVYSGATYIPLDAKFPKEDYERLQLASEAGDIVNSEIARKALLQRIEGCAKDISEKYIAPPVTTNFAIMFLATEGLYAEALREPGFQERLHRQYRVIIAGPTTLSAILCSLSVGFQSADIERRSGEIHTVLSAVKTEFGKFGDVLSKVKKQLGTASRSIDATFVRTRKMAGALDSITALPADKTSRVFELLAGGAGLGVGTDEDDSSGESGVVGDVQSEQEELVGIGDGWEDGGN